VRSVLIGRSAERARLEAALAGAVDGRGSLVLVSGEAGTGKTRLIEEVFAAAREATVVHAAAVPGGSPFGPLTTAIRGYLRMEPAGLNSCGPLRAHLALLLPELGEARPSADRATLFEALRCGLVAVVAQRPAAILLDDLQWSDDATLEFLAWLAPTLAELPLLVVGGYRTEELSRSHPLRRLRDHLRRARLLDEVALGPLGETETAALVEQVLGRAACRQLAGTLHDRTAGVPFFVEELTAALRTGGRLRDGAEGVELDLDAAMPVPGTVRDAVLVHMSALPEAARVAAEVAAVAGPAVDLDLVAGMADEQGLAELMAAGLLVDTEPGRARFRNPLAREAIYDDVPWLRRRVLHRRLAEALDAGGHDPAEIAAHWLAARDTSRALEAMLEAVAARRSVHAHRDAARLGRQALEVWPEGERESERIAVVEQYAVDAELAGDLAEAARAQQEVVTSRRAAGSGRALADAERRIAAIYALQGDRARALAARRVAAEAYAANGFPGEAAAERLVTAGYLQSAGRHAEAAATARVAGQEAVRAERTDLRARAMGLEGVARAKLGAFDEGTAIIRAGLALALEHELTPEAAEVYQRLGSAYEVAGDYGSAHAALGTAIGLCEPPGTGGLEQTCLSCMAYVLRELGDWDQVEQLCADLITMDARPDDTLVADGVLGAVLLWRGHGEDARPLLSRCLETAMRLDVISMLCDSAAALAWLADADGDPARTHELCRLLLDRWTASEDHHYAVWGLRWSACWLARNGALTDARACAGALSAIAASAGHHDTLAALAHALGEVALAEGEIGTAAVQLSRAVELHEGLDIPFERAQILLRAGVAFAAAGERETALERLADGYRLARRLGASPLAAEIAAQVAELGASLEEQLGRRAAAEHERAGLSRRELEVMRLAARGLTNREIAERLVLSIRTVDMHMRNILAKLRCRTRTEAARRASEFGLLTEQGTP
jgi:DNA-binding CsgD family transcriptional regulator/tetratricopeptide (TPR) repeat protein